MQLQGITELNRGGRKRKAGARYPSGKLRPESPEEAMGPALQRYVATCGPGVVVRHPQTGQIVSVDRMAGYTLGILRLRGMADPGDPGGISEEQFDAGNTWAEVVHRHAQIMGYELRRTPKSPSFVLVVGTSTAPDPSDAAIAAIRDRWRGFYDALCECARTYTVQAYKPGWAIVDICYQVCIENRQINTLSPVDIGNLRVGLNALARAIR